MIILPKHSCAKGKRAKIYPDQTRIENSKTGPFQGLNRWEMSKL
jgi:hypothetical protein